MATTSPDNIRTPNPGDPYNLVADLAVLANDVQDALDTRANVYKGTAAQRVSFLSTATPGMLWQDTDGIGMLWKRGTSQWVPAVWRWAGTTAQMNGFTQAPNGFAWFSTTDNQHYVRSAGVWRAGGPYAMASGMLTSTSSWKTATFPSGRFTQAPRVVAQMISGASGAIGLGVMVTGVTPTSFQYRHHGASGEFEMHWMAIQMTASSASG